MSSKCTEIFSRLIVLPFKDNRPIVLLTKFKKVSRESQCILASPHKDHLVFQDQCMNLHSANFWTTCIPQTFYFWTTGIPILSLFMDNWYPILFLFLDNLHSPNFFYISFHALNVVVTSGVVSIPLLI